jgi:hypothetical protein
MMNEEIADKVVYKDNSEEDIACGKRLDMNGQVETGATDEMDFLPVIKELMNGLDIWSVYDKMSEILYGALFVDKKQEAVSQEYPNKDQEYYNNQTGAKETYSDSQEELIKLIEENKKAKNEEEIFLMMQRAEEEIPDKQMTLFNFESKKEAKKEEPRKTAEKKPLEEKLNKAA